MAVINWDEIVGDASLEAGGYVGDLMKVARVHIAEAVRNNEITHAEAGQVYTAMIPAAFQNGIGFRMEKEKIDLSKVPSTL